MKHKTGWPPEPGFRYPSQYKDIKVMAIVDGYVMARYMGCSPFAEAHDEFELRIKREAKALEGKA